MADANIKRAKILMYKKQQQKRTKYVTEYHKSSCTPNIHK